jgi:hypothetical protein
VKLAWKERDNKGKNIQFEVAFKEKCHPENDFIRFEMWLECKSVGRLFGPLFFPTPASSP